MDLISTQLSPESTEQGRSFNHEIRNTLCGVNGLLSMLKVTDLSVTQKKIVNLLHCSVNNICQVMSFIQEKDVSQDMYKVNEKTFQVKETLIESFEPLYSLAEIKDLELKINIEEYRRDFFGDQQKIIEMLMQILSNAIKFSVSGEILVDILVSDKLNVVISDMGTGMNQETLDSIFDTEIVDYKDCYKDVEGLGLLMVKRLADLIDAKISAQSSFNKGTVYEIVIPEAVSQSNDVFNSQEYERVKQLNYSILVVDDEPINRMYLSDLLKKKKMKVLCAKDGADAVEKCRDNRFDLILMDVGMPVLNGLDATKIIRKTKGMQNNDTPIVALTANANISANQIVKKLGITDYIIKPFCEKSLLEKVESLLLKI